MARKGAKWSRAIAQRLKSLILNYIRRGSTINISYKVHRSHQGKNKTTKSVHLKSRKRPAKVNNKNQRSITRSNIIAPRHVHGTLCLMCGEPIPLARLEALPEANACVVCAEKKENLSKDPPYHRPTIKEHPVEIGNENQLPIMRSNNITPRHVCGTPCHMCGKPIPLARLKALPEANVCVVCAEKGAKLSKDPPYPQPPQNLNTCPRCKAPTVVRQNSQDKSYFIGCTSFPRCRYTANFS